MVIEDGAIDYSQQFECTLCRQVKVNESVLIHGIAPSELANGLPPAEALLSFMEFAAGSIILAFHAPFDQRMLGRALKNELGYSLENSFLDVADLAPMLFPEAMIHRGSLDHWLDYFNIHIPQRHNASADAMATAEIALILLNRAQRIGLTTLTSWRSASGAGSAPARRHSTRSEPDGTTAVVRTAMTDTDAAMPERTGRPKSRAAHA